MMSPGEMVSRIVEANLSTILEITRLIETDYPELYEIIIDKLETEI